MLKFIAPVLVVVAASAVIGAEHTKDSLKTVKANIDAKKAVLVDVREESEWKEGHIDGALLVPLSELDGGPSAEKLIKGLPKGKIVYTHCVVGQRSADAADILIKKGFDVRPLKEGYEELVKAGFPKAK